METDYGSFTSEERYDCTPHEKKREWGDYELLTPLEWYAEKTKVIGTKHFIGD